MAQFVPWSSQPLDEWAKKYAAGKFIDLDGLSMHYIEKGEGDPVILLHGFFYDSFMWNKNMDVLAERFKVYAIDLWGFGYSTRQPLDYGYPLYVNQLLKFMDALNIQKASLVGQSIGGGTCIAFCIDHRDKVNKMILVDAAGMPNPLPLMGKLAILPKVGEFMHSYKGNLIRKITLRTTFIYDKIIITDSYFDNVTRFHKVKESMFCIYRGPKTRYRHPNSGRIRRTPLQEQPFSSRTGQNGRSNKTPLCSIQSRKPARLAK